MFSSAVSGSSGGSDQNSGASRTGSLSGWSVSTDSTTFRFNSDREDGFSFGHSAIHNYEDGANLAEGVLTACEGCCGPAGVCLAVIGMVGFVLLSAAASADGGGWSSSNHCWEACYTNNGVSICQCIFGG